MVVEACAFETERLSVADWHRLSPGALSTFVMALLTSATTAQLPPDWQGDYDRRRAERWIAERDAEGTVLLATEAGSPVGLLLLYEEPDSTGGSSVRLGYVISEAAAGQGLASELLAGFVSWSRARPTIRALIGGVEAGNAASIRVLQKCGFAPAAAAATDSLEYRLQL